ncbi:hypothetical protein K0U27_00250 [archaeon]|nr:hypothetical protein [archaeon]
MEKHEELEKPQEKLSICEIMKDDTSEVMRKMESQVPSLFQNYSNLYTKYLHMLDDMFGTGYITEKKFFDNLDIDQGILRQLKANSESVKNSCMQNIEMSSNLFDQYVKMRVDAIKSYDNYVHVMMNSYANFLSQNGRY